MKKLNSIFSLLLIMLVMISCDEEKTINGNWKLLKVETPNETLMPKVDYLVNVQDQKINFNLDVNSCFADIEIKNDSILYQVAGCTKMCCDGQIDTIGGFLNYSGAYSLKNDTLIISNENKYFLVKIHQE